jgi:hypothetical protein
MVQSERRGSARIGIVDVIADLVLEFVQSDHRRGSACIVIVDVLADLGLVWVQSDHRRGSARIVIVDVPADHPLRMRGAVVCCVCQKGGLI